MANIASLVVDVSARTDGLNRGLNSAYKDVSKFAANAAKTLAVLGTAITAGAVAAMISLKRAVNETAEGIDRLAKLSSRLSIPVGDFQALSYAADQAGIDTESLAKALTFMKKNLGEAIRSGGEGARAFEDLGISISSLRTMSSIEQFQLISKALRGITDDSIKFAIGQKIFGKGFSEVTNLISDDVEGLIEEYNGLGVALTDTQAKGVEAFNDMKNTFDQFSLGFKQQVTANIAPAITGIIGYFVELVKQAGGIQEVARSASVSLLQFGINGIRAVSGMIGWFLKLGNIVAQIKLAIETVAVSFARFNEVVNNAAKNTKNGGNFWGETAFELFNPDQSVSQRASDTLRPAVQNLTESTDKLANFQDTANKTISDLTNIINKQINTLQSTKTNSDQIAATANKAQSGTNIFSQGNGSFSDRPMIESDVNVKIEVSDNLLKVIDQRVDSRMSNAADTRF